jgi:hypothetical protein
MALHRKRAIWIGALFSVGILFAISCPPPGLTVLTSSPLPDGTYHFVGVDEEGNEYEAPNESVNPKITITGSPIRHRGEKGKLTLRSDADVTVIL